MITLERFTYYIEKIKDHSNYIDGLYGVLSYEVLDNLHTTSSALIEMLEEITGDNKNQWINYWIFELNFGELYKEGSVTFNNVNVPLETIEDLYVVLMDNISQ